MKKLGVALTFLLFLLPAPLVQAANIYVSESGTGAGTIADPASLWDALATAKSNGESDTVFLGTGQYSHDPGFVYDVSGTDTTSLTLSGGWNATYTEQGQDPALTKLDGQNARRVLRVIADGAGANLTVTLKNLAVLNGRTTTYAAPPGDTGYGGGIWAENLGGARLKLVMERCIVQDNKVENAVSRGGGLAITSDFELRECSFTGNRSVEAGGAIASNYAAPYTTDLAPVIEDSYFMDNRSSNSGGSHLITYVSPVVRRTTFRGRADGGSLGGGAVNPNNGAHPIFENCEFTGNVSDYWGGAFYFHDAGAEFRNCLFEGNEADNKGLGCYGGAISAYTPPGDSTLHTITIVNSTFVGNRVSLAGTRLGAAIYNRVQTLVVVNSIFWDNGTSAAQGGAYALYRESGSASVSFSDVQDGLGGTNFTGDNNISASPISGYSWGHPYRIPADSPCVDAGDNAATLAAGLVVDWEGQPRIFGGNDPAVRKVDMGRDEYYDGVLSVTSPSKGDTWLNDGAAKKITWTCTNIPGNVRLSLWLESPGAGGQELVEIAKDLPCADQAYTWGGLPADLPAGNEYALVIESNEMSALVEWSYFSIRTLRITSPAAGGTWLNNATDKKITWVCDNVPGPVRLSLWLGSPAAGGQELVQIVADLPCTDQAYTWNGLSPDLPAGDNYALVIQPKEFAPLAVWNVFSVRALRLTSPNGGQSLVQGSTYAVTWQSANLPGALIGIELYNGAARAATLSAGAPDTGRFSWKVSYALAPGASYRVRIFTAGQYGAEDWSEGPFAIVPAVTLTAPNGGQTWKRGLVYRIAWTYRNAPGTSVRLELYKGGAFKRTIVASWPVGKAGRGSYLWRVPPTQLPARNYTVKIRSTKYPKCFDFSNRSFTIAR